MRQQHGRSLTQTWGAASIGQRRKWRPCSAWCTCSQCRGYHISGLHASSRVVQHQSNANALSFGRDFCIVMSQNTQCSALLHGCMVASWLLHVGCSCVVSRCKYQQLSAQRTGNSNTCLRPPPGNVVFPRLMHGRLLPCWHVHLMFVQRKLA